MYAVPATAPKGNGATLEHQDDIQALLHFCEDQETLHMFCHGRCVSEVQA